MHKPDTLCIEHYNYPLPQERIAQYPLSKRDESKLLVFNGSPQTAKFKDVADFLPKNSFLVFNNTKVVQARLNFQKESGARIEVFCLEPHKPTREIQEAFLQKETSVWKCLVGNRKKWKNEILKMSFEVEGQKAFLLAERLSDVEESSFIRFTWNPENLTFSEVLEQSGKVPLPPYMHRKAEAEDCKRYQTIYAQHDGSVAAPTAGLHFTEDVFQALRKKGISSDNVTLHVGAGTFKPVSSKKVSDHQMHIEQILVNRTLIEKLIKLDDKTIIAVGTTSIRTLESLFWLGTKMHYFPHLDNYTLGQWEAYDLAKNTRLSKKTALSEILHYLDKKQDDVFRSETQILIGSGYEFQIIDGMITNFHQPKSTLLLLISAYLGDDWKSIYQYALENDYRFLSYGDSCLFLKE
ncbi:MAG: S-adenosylmethionine:tRNA ribosyltransferase-isomerase [Bacteroidales bacterium]|nr:S-adenosylmethionine:tRNA ribosyltransferase-isomerase [Bacteroidales bacterium]